jgi:hypothetical protein
MMSFGDLLILIITFSWVFLFYFSVKFGELHAKKKYNKLNWAEEREFKRSKIFAGLAGLLCFIHAIYF